MHILLVDDHPEVSASLGEFLVQLGHDVDRALSGQQALSCMEIRRPDLVVTDLRMPGMDGLALIDACEALDDPPPVALMTAFGDQSTAIEALRRGAVDYLRKPVDVAELHRLVERFEPNQTKPVSDGEMIILGPTMTQVVARADRLHMARDLPCLIQGETGTGKELIARRIHHGGQPPGGPFIAVNTAAIPEGLFEAEIFGYESGAFTGARAEGAPGKAELAAGGTLFLDEIGDLPKDQQAKLLRLLEQRSFFRVGGSKEQHFAGRIIAATNADLIERVHQGQFREDLYYRLKVGHIILPTICERDETVVEMARRLLTETAKKRGRPSMRFASDAEAAIAAHTWPGNVRELIHCIEQALIHSDGAVISATHLAIAGSQGGTSAARRAPGAPLVLPSLPPADLVLPEAGFDVDAWHRAIIAAALLVNRQSPVRTADYLGISRKVLYTLRKRYGLIDESDVE